MSYPSRSKSVKSGVSSRQMVSHKVYYLLHAIKSPDITMLRQYPSILAKYLHFGSFLSSLFTPAAQYRVTR